MPQVQNLLDMFLNGRKDVQAKSAKAPPSKSQPSTVEGSRDLLPSEVDRKGASSRKSFQSKIKESRARLAAKADDASQANRIPDVKTEPKGSKRNDDVRSGKNRSDRPDRADRSNPSDHARPQLRRTAKGDDRNETQAGTADRSGEGWPSAQAMPEKPHVGDRMGENAAGWDETAARALKEGLERMGVHASDAQLLDPAFLGGLLLMLQGLSLPVEPGIGDAPGEPGVPESGETEAGKGLAMGAVQTDGPEPFSEESPAALEPHRAPAFPDQAAQAGSVEADSGELQAIADLAREAQAMTEEGKSAERKDLAALIRNRMEELSAGAAEPRQDGQSPITAKAPTTTPQGWQGTQVRPRTESVTTDPLPMADLDRLRVLQAAALQAGRVARESEASPAPQASQAIGSAESIEDRGNAASATERSADSSAGDNGDLPEHDTDLFGGNGDASGNAEAAARKDGVSGPQFQTSLEQARSADHRATFQRAWEARPAFEPAALDQIARKLAAIGHKNGEEINIQLSPEHLGKVRVSLEMREGAMTARISVESDAVRQQMEAGISTLRDALENQGIKLQGLEVSVDQRQSSLFNPDGSNAESFFQRNGRGARDGSQGEAEVAPFESAPESDTGRRWGYNTMEYIG